MSAEAPHSEADPGEGIGLRERKKAETRDRIHMAALDLFERQGFDDTTVSEIAHRADVSPRTVFVYFPTKEAIAFGAVEQFLDDLESRLEGRADGETVSDALRDWLLDLVSDGESKKAETDDRLRRLISREPALQAFDLRVHERAESIIARAVAEEIKRDPEDALPRMVGAATIAAMRSIGHALDDRPRDQALELIKAYVDDLIAFVGAGIGAVTPR